MLGGLLKIDGGTGDELESGESGDSAPAPLLRMRGDPGGPGVASLEERLALLKLVRDIELPTDLFAHALPHEVERTGGGSRSRRRMSFAATRSSGASRQSRKPLMRFFSPCRRRSRPSWMPKYWLRAESRSSKRMPR